MKKYVLTYVYNYHNIWIVVPETEEDPLCSLPKTTFEESSEAEDSDFNSMVPVPVSTPNLP